MARNQPVGKRTAPPLLVAALVAATGAATGAGAPRRAPGGGGEPVRYFVGIELAPAPREALDVLAGELRRLGPARGLRWSPAPAYHLTLRFLGELDAPTLEAVAAALDAVALESPPLALAVRGLGSFPWRGRGGPRVLWAGVAEPHPDLDALAARVDEAVRGVGLPPADFPFNPHVTLARADRGAVAGALAGALERLAEAEVGPWPVASFVLFEAHRPEAAGGYVEVRRFPLAGGR